MAPIIETSEETLRTLNPQIYTRRFDLESKSDTKLFNKSDFVYVPSINLYVAKERKLLGKNWFESHQELQKNSERMLIIPEFVEFLKYAKTNHPEIYNEITEVRNPWRAEWLDADFKTKGKDLEVRYNHLFDNEGNIVKYDSEILDKETLMKNKTPGISLESWLQNPTKQGLPNKDTKSEDLFYWFPLSDNNSVARFDAYSVGTDLDCGRSPSGRGSGGGVRAVKARVSSARETIQYF
ncbi:hypothetical protein J4474_02675 [Candidatus Pacearchaeota archaeon]|nr:hypothetical protein [Candidatus Pacearchaeota archaeon]